MLESPNVGVVIAVNKRFYCTAQLFDHSCSSDACVESIDIEVVSPQFGQKWNYSFDKRLKSLQNDPSQPENVFVEKTLRVTLLALLDSDRHNLLSRIELTIKGDNDFYSLIPHLLERDEPKTLLAALALPPFLPAARVDGKIIKTGLGSSACLVTSLVASLCYSLMNQHSNYDIERSKNTIFRLAQIAHCHAQGKIGSGFDVASAVYGSHIYERFPKSLLADLLTLLEENVESLDNVQQAIKSVLETEWDGGIRGHLSLPNFVEVMLADVSGGSESPSMAKTVLAWKNTFTDKPVPHWDDLVHINKKIATLLQNLGDTKVSEEQVEFLINTPQKDWNSCHIGRVLLELRTVTQASRRHLKAMGDAAGVPIEPQEQTDLLDATLDIPGVIAALVPGAGGYDAVACLYINRPKVQHDVAHFWCSWPQASVCPLTVQSAKHADGVRLETSITHN